MSHLRDLLGVAREGLQARPARTILVALGPLFGVAAIVGVVGIGDSTRGELRAVLRDLGTELIVVSAQPSVADAERPRLPIEAASRVARLPTVSGVAAMTTLGGIGVRPSRHPGSDAMIAPVSVRTANQDLLDVLRIGLAHGRFVGPTDDRVGARSAVLGASLAAVYGMVPGETRTILLDDRVYGVVGVLSSARLAPELDWAVLITPATAAREWGEDGRPSSLYVRSSEGQARTTARLLPLAITYGGPGLPAVSIPSDLLAADAQIDTTLRITAFAMGGLAMLVGAIGIANVLTISVLQRSTEIGVRRALGHPRLLIAGQFVLEALVVGLVGGVIGAGLAVGIVALVADQQGWVTVIDPLIVVTTTALAVAVSVVAGIYPAWRAARLDPLAVLRA